MPKYDVMIEYKADASGVPDRELSECLDWVTKRLEEISAVVVLHGNVLAVEAEVEASGPSAALGGLEMRFDEEMDRAGLIEIVGDTTSFWVTDTERTKAQLLLLKSKTA